MSGAGTPDGEVRPQGPGTGIRPALSNGRPMLLHSVVLELAGVVDADVAVTVGAFVRARGARAFIE